jgi:hypothetical protein
MHAIPTPEYRAIGHYAYQQHIREASKHPACHGVKKKINSVLFHDV